MKIHRETAKQNQTYRALLNDLRMGRWQANTFPAERELAAAYAVSRTTIRKTLAMLEADGTISRQRGWRNTITFSGVRNLNLLWLSVSDINHASPPRLQLYDILQKYAQNCQTSFTYCQIYGDTRDNWLKTHLHEYDGIVISDVSSEQLMPELATLLRQYPNTLSLQRIAGDLAAATCTTDNWYAGYLAAEYLLRNGFQHIGVIAVSPGLHDKHFHDRVNGFCDYCMDHADTIRDCNLVISRNFDDFKNPERILRKLKPVERHIDALFVLSDNLALRCIEALKKFDLSVPKDISVIGCDDLQGNTDAPPTLTTISHPINQIAEYVWQKLMQNISLTAKPQHEEKSFKPILIERSTVLKKNK